MPALRCFRAVCSALREAPHGGEVLSARIDCLSLSRRDSPGGEDRGPSVIHRRARTRRSLRGTKPDAMVCPIRQPGGGFVRRRLVGLVVLGMCVGAATADAQGTARIVGSVYDSLAHAPLAGATVVATPRTLGAALPERTTITDASGAFLLD